MGIKTQWLRPPLPNADSEPELRFLAKERQYKHEHCVHYQFYQKMVTPHKNTCPCERFFRNLSINLCGSRYHISSIRVRLDCETRMPPGSNCTWDAGPPSPQNHSMYPHLSNQVPVPRILFGVFDNAQSTNSGYISIIALLHPRNNKTCARYWL
ncbi:hypothetical protein ARMSODRAFT_300167 [Armillaria solidipes]|uniref:Uncharacterized protein n=1 Tax=Armillaria solidipes TaxID=1076256 RepID=A0A2H3BNZ2_9AGAR|nr:hypothetical protein ARMSODRAFT_300167 [Armillaria solidipes]